jgi:hypothetical protein
VRLQTRVCPYSGPWHCFTSIVRQEGAASLFRGLSAPLVGGAIETGINYAVYVSTLRRLTGEPVTSGFSAAVPVAAASAGVVLSIALSPFELIKVRMQTDRAYRGPGDCARHVIKEEGYAGLMRGLRATMAREVPGNAIYFR